MANRCEFNRLHASQQEAAACPGCLTVLPQSSRHRRNAIVNQLKPDLQDAAPSSPTVSWETISNMMGTSREITPLDMGEATYATPSTSQNHRLESPPDAAAGWSNLLSWTPFTPRSASPAPLLEASSNLVHHSYDLLGNLQTASAFQTTSRSNFTTASPPPVPPSSPMAPDTLRRYVDGGPVYRSKLLEIEKVVRAGRAREADDDALAGAVAQTHLASEAAIAPEADIPLPSIEPTDDDDNNNIPPADHLREIADLRTTQASLTRQLVAATKRTDMLRRRSNIAEADRDRAIAGLNAAETELRDLQNQRDEVEGGWRGCTMNCKALFLMGVLSGLYAFYRGVLYEAEFEYIFKRSMEVLGLVYERAKREYVGPDDGEY